MNSITSFNFFTHGSISYTGTNINCVGQSLRMANGNVNKNMMKSLHYLIGIHTLHLTAINGDVLYPGAQTIIAPDTTDHGQYKTSTIIWDMIDKDRCDLLLVNTVEFSSVHDEEWFSDVHKIQLSTKENYHHSKCNKYNGHSY